MMFSLHCRHVQCVLNFANNLEEDGGTIIVPKFHKHIRQWCADNCHLRNKVPFLTFEKKQNKESKIVGADSAAAGIDTNVPVSPGVDADDAVSGTYGAGGRKFVTKKQKQKKQQQPNVRGNVSTGDEETALLALAQRVPMREVSSDIVNRPALKSAP